MRLEGAYPITSEAFYRMVVLAVILFGVETRVLVVDIKNLIVGVHTGFAAGDGLTGKEEMVWDPAAERV